MVGAARKTGNRRRVQIKAQPFFIERGMLLKHKLRDTARGIGIGTKSRALTRALQIGFSNMADMGASRKALIFTESRRTQEYLKSFLEANGYSGQIVLFSGSNSDADSQAIYKRWIEANRIRPSCMCVCEFSGVSVLVLVSLAISCAGVHSRARSQFQ